MNLQPYVQLVLVLVLWVVVLVLENSQFIVKCKIWIQIYCYCIYSMLCVCVCGSATRLLNWPVMMILWCRMFCLGLGLTNLVSFPSSSVYKTDICSSTSSIKLETKAVASDCGWLLTLRPRRSWYTRNCTWSSVNFWVLTMLLRSAPIKCVTRYLEQTSIQFVQIQQFCDTVNPTLSTIRLRVKINTAELHASHTSSNENLPLIQTMYFYSMPQRSMLYQL